MKRATKRTGNASRFAMRSAGFTLVELLIVVVLVGLMAAIAAPNIDRESFQVKAAANEVLSTITAAKHMAVLKQHDVVLAFDATNRNIRIHSDLDGDRVVDTGEDTRLVELPDHVSFGKGGAPALGGVVSMNLTQTQGSLPSMTFHRNGSASQEARFYVTSMRGAQGNGFPEDARAFSIARATGRVECRNYSTAHSWRSGC